VNPRQDLPDEPGLRDQDPDAPLTSRWPAAGLDIFWPILAVVLVVAVVFVASVAHNSMDSVGVPVSQNQTPAPRPTNRDDTRVIVQISSHTTRSAAQAANQEMIDRGFDTRVLKSDNYRGLNRGYYVVYTGPYPNTTAGRAEAKQVQVRVTGALVRDIHPRQGDDQTGQ
jgi:hypothetical protein